jgi:hypothetical protein
MRTYKFHVLCASGEWRDFECQATDFSHAREQLAEFAKNN